MITTNILDRRGFLKGQVHWCKGGFWRASRVVDWRRGGCTMPAFASALDAAAFVLGGAR